MTAAPAPEGRGWLDDLADAGLRSISAVTAVPAPPPAPAPEAATPDPVAATVAALVELAHNRNGASRIAREGISGRSQERACQLEGEAIGLDAAAALVRERLAPAWDALAARLAEAEAERDGLRARVDYLAGQWERDAQEPRFQPWQREIYRRNAEWLRAALRGDRDAG